MKLRLVESPKTKDTPTPRDRGTWDCTLCTAFGTGGVNGWHRHYIAEHYEAAK